MKYNNIKTYIFWRLLDSKYLSPCVNQFLCNMLGMWKVLILKRVKYEERLIHKRVYCKWIRNKLLSHKEMIAYAFQNLLTKYGYIIVVKKVWSKRLSDFQFLYSIVLIRLSLTDMSFLLFPGKYLLWYLLWINLSQTRSVENLTGIALYQ